jgi:hypothetical protein
MAILLALVFVLAFIAQLLIAPGHDRHADGFLAGHGGPRPTSPSGP